MLPENSDCTGLLSDSTGICSRQRECGDRALRRIRSGLHNAGTVSASLLRFLTMHRFVSRHHRLFFCGCLLAVSCLRPVDRVLADEDGLAVETTVDLSAPARRQYGRAVRAIEDLNGYLTAIRFQRTAFIGTNYFGVSVGGIDAIRDLEEGRGVDPETLAALYAGFAIPSVAADLNLKRDRDPRGNVILKIDAADGRLRYKGAVIRMYSPARLRELFDRRAAFRTDNERRRNEIFSQYAAERRRRVGNLDVTGLTTESQELTRRYEELQPILADLETALRSETNMNAIIGGLSGQHYFGYSVGGIDVVSELNQRRAIDPETYAAVFADRISVDYADSFSIRDGRVFFQDNEVSLYAPETLESFFRRRQRLALRTVGR